MSAQILSMFEQNPQLAAQLAGAFGGAGGVQQAAPAAGGGGGAGAAGLVSQAAMLTGNPEVSVGISAAQSFGKYNSIYTFVIVVFLSIFTLWILTGILSGSYISADEGIDFSANEFSSWS